MYTLQTGECLERVHITDGVYLVPTDLYEAGSVITAFYRGEPRLREFVESALVTHIGWWGLDVSCVPLGLAPDPKPPLVL